MLVLDHLSVAFGVVRPIDRLNLTVSAPTHGVIGPNGAGKTTLLNTLNGFITPVAGTMEAFGTRLDTMAVRRRARWGLRRTFQTEQLAEDLSIGGNIAVALDHCPAHRGRGVSEAAELVGLEGLDRPVAELTTVERRLTEIARAVVGEPRLVLMDEPAAGVSGDDRRALVEVLSRIQSETGAWVVIIDHDVELISAVCETTTALDFGSLIATGPTADVLADPAVAEVYLGGLGVGS